MSARGTGTRLGAAWICAVIASVLVRAICAEVAGASPEADCVPCAGYDLANASGTRCSRLATPWRDSSADVLTSGRRSKRCKSWRSR